VCSRREISETCFRKPRQARGACRMRGVIHPVRPGHAGASGPVETCVDSVTQRRVRAHHVFALLRDVVDGTCLDESRVGACAPPLVAVRRSAWPELRALVAGAMSLSAEGLCGRPDARSWWRVRRRMPVRRDPSSVPAPPAPSTRHLLIVPQACPGRPPGVPQTSPRRPPDGHSRVVRGTRCGLTYVPRASEPVATSTNCNRRGHRLSNGPLAEDQG
jgi:hypothetical protein